MFGTKIKAHHDKVVLDRKVLADYVEDHHHNAMYGRCKADGLEWPCPTYVAIQIALDRPNHCC